VNLLMKKKNI